MLMIFWASASAPDARAMRSTMRDPEWLPKYWQSTCQSTTESFEVQSLVTADLLGSAPSQVSTQTHPALRLVIWWRPCMTYDLRGVSQDQPDMHHPQLTRHHSEPGLVTPCAWKASLSGAFSNVLLSYTELLGPSTPMSHDRSNRKLTLLLAVKTLLSDKKIHKRRMIGEATGRGEDLLRAEAVKLLLHHVLAVATLIGQDGTVSKCLQAPTHCDIWEYLRSPSKAAGICQNGNVSKCLSTLSI